MVGSGDAPALFFECTPNEILDNVLRFLSRIPNSRKWETHIDIRDILELFDVRGDWGSSLKSRFNTLVISKSNYRYYEKERFGWKERKEAYYITDSFEVARDFLLRGAGNRWNHSS